MITRDELIRSKEYWLAQMQSMLYRQVEDYLKENKMTKSEFAKKLGVSKGYVSQILNGDFDHKLSKFIELSLMIDKVPVLNLVNLHEVKFPDEIKRDKKVKVRNFYKDPEAMEARQVSETDPGDEK